MGLLSQILSKLQPLDTPSVDKALAAALPTAGPSQSAQIARTLLDRNLEEGKLGLVRHFHRLPQQCQQAIIDNIDRFYGAMRQACQLRPSEAPRNVTQIIELSGCTRLAYLIGDQLVHGPSRQREAAADCLLRLAQRQRAPGDVGGSSSVDAESAGFLQATIEHAIGTYDSHRQVQLLYALAALTPKPMPMATQQLSMNRCRAMLELGELLRRADDENICRAMLAWIDHPTISEHVLAGLDHAVAGRRLEFVLENGHLLADGRVQRALRAIAKPDALAPSVESAMRMQSRTLRLLPRWICTLPLEPNQSIHHLASLKRLSDRSARLGALRGLMALARGQAATSANRAICEFCDDADLTIARIALRHLIRVQLPNLARLLLRLVSSDHEQIQQIATARMVTLGFDRLWSSWPLLSSDQRLCAGRGMIKLDAEFHARLGRKLARPDQSSRVRALAIIHGLNQGNFFEQPLLTLAQSQDVRIASAAVRALGTAATEQSVFTLGQSLRHPNSRVRANAIEALQQLGAELQPRMLFEMARHDENRPRANAIGAMLALRDEAAITTLRDMLGDARPNHRTSALWLVESLGVVELAPQVGELSITDRDHRVRDRAGNVIAYLLDAMRRPQADSTSPQLALAA